MPFDPLAALGVAANVVQCLDYSSKILAKALEIYSSADGVSWEHEYLGTLTSSLQSAASSLARLDEVHSHMLTQPERGLVDLAKKCSLDATELQSIIGGLKVTGKNRKLKSIQQAIKGSRHKGKVQALEKRLNGYRAEFTTQLTFLLRYVIEGRHAIRCASSTDRHLSRTCLYTLNPSYISSEKSRFKCHISSNL